MTFADIENQTFLELIEQKCFQKFEPKEDPDSKFINISSEDNRTVEEKVETEHFIPYYKDDYHLAFGSPNYFIFLKCIFVMYQRLRLAQKIIKDKVDSDFEKNKEAVIHAYKAYKKSQDRIKENRGVEKTAHEGGKENEINEDEKTIKDRVSRHRLAILIGISMTKYKSKLDNNTFEDLVRVFLGVKSFFFFTFDKLIVLTNKSFQ